MRASSLSVATALVTAAFVAVAPAWTEMTPTETAAEASSVPAPEATTARPAAEFPSTADQHAAAGDHGGHGEAGIQDQLLSPNFAVTVATWLTFGIVAWLLAKFGWGPITAALDEREKKIAEDVRRAEEARAAAEALLARYEAQLGGARAEADKILSEARQRAEQVGQRLQAEARENAEAITARAMQQIEAERQKAVAELRGIVAEAAVELAGRILREELDEKRHARLIDDVVGQIAAKR